MEQHPPAAEHAADDAPRRRLPVRLATGAVHWATATRLHMAISGVAGLFILALVFATWSYIAHLAVESLQPATIEMALAALDAGNVEQAKSIIGDMQTQVATPDLIGGAMFVLGAIRAREADHEISSERRSAMFQVAARYLTQSHAQGVPEGREAEAAFLLGKSLVNSGRPESGVGPLNEALRLHAKPETEIHALLVRALLESPDPNLEEALAHNEQVIGDAKLEGNAHDEAWLLRAETLLRLGRPADATAALGQVSRDSAYEGRRMLLMGQLEIDAANALPGNSPERAAKIDAAIRQFQTAQQLDADDGELTRQALYRTAQCYELRGDRTSARAQYNRLSNLYGDTDEGLAAALAEADFARADGETDRALAGYRAVLQAVGNPQTYDNNLMPLSTLRVRLLAAYQQFVGDEQFAESLALLDVFEPVVGRAESMELRAKTHQSWGARRRDQGAEEGLKEAEPLVKEGRFHMRAAGRAYEDLARMRYATRYFTRDLWAAADCYFQGQSYTHAARLLAEYLHNEARQWNDVALVRLGQARLARGEFQSSIAALEECIEIYPENPATHQARLEASRAYRQLGKFDEAERLLRANLEAPALTPQSPEWRDSLFDLGHLLYEKERYAESVDALREAVMRYPDNQSTLLAKYMIARAYHSDAEALTVRLRKPNSENEAQANRSRKLIGENLENAHATYLEVQQTITLAGNDADDPLTRELLRNCYMMQGSVLMELRRFEEARQAFQNVISLYQDDPVVLESFVQVANCWRRLDQPAMARGNLERAKVVLDKLPKNADFLASTNFNRQQWSLLLDEMSRW
jgi:tetratricopeptide (TPR) repeat protein